MDTDVFLDRCDAIEKGLHELADDLYASIEDGQPGDEREELVKLAKEKIESYDEFFAELEDDGEREEAEGVLNREIKRLRRAVQRIESGS